MRIAGVGSVVLWSVGDSGMAGGVQTVYLDYNATTPLDAAVREVMLPFLGDVFGNPSSVHRVGRRARAHLDECRERTATCLGCRPSEIVFTSGGTESCNLAVLGAARAGRHRGRHLIASAIEHHAVLQPMQSLAEHEGFELSLVPVDRWGRIDPADVLARVRPDTVLVSIMAANNEVGTMQPVGEIGAFCRERRICFHTDAVQWFGKEPFESVDPFQADLVSLCGHKLHGPKGAGVLYIRSPLRLQPVLLGGSHEDDRRAGTENLASIAGLTVALERFLRPPVFPEKHLRPLQQALREGVRSIPGLVIRTPEAGCLSNTLAFTVQGCDSLALLANLDLEGICASSGSACSAGSLEPSHVLSAMGVPEAEVRSLVRLSMGRETTRAEIDLVVELLPRLIHRIRSHPTAADQELRGNR